MQSIADNKASIKELEDQILMRLQAEDLNLLEDEGLILALQESKEKASEVASALE